MYKNPVSQCFSAMNSNTISPILMKFCALCIIWVNLRGRKVFYNLTISGWYHMLSKMYRAFISFEFCSSVKHIKYICKYINKNQLFGHI